MVEKLTFKELSKSIIIGLVKGVIYYLVFYIILVSLIINYLIPFLYTSLGIGNINTLILLDNIGYNVLKYNLLIVFVLLSIIGSILRRNIPYGSVFASFLGFILLYIVLTDLKLDNMVGEIDKYMYYVDLSQLVTSIIYISFLFALGNAIFLFRKEYIKHEREKIT